MNTYAVIAQHSYPPGRKDGHFIGRALAPIVIVLIIVLVRAALRRLDRGPKA